MGVTLRVKVKSEDIREQLKINIKMIEDIMQYQKQWHNHFKKMHWLTAKACILLQTYWMTRYGTANWEVPWPMDQNGQMFWQQQINGSIWPLDQNMTSNPNPWKEEEEKEVQSIQHEVNPCCQKFV